MRKIIKNTEVLLRKIYKIVYLNPLKKREFRFRQLLNKYIKETKNKIFEDYFITCSNQVWKPYFTNTSSLYFLTFSPQRKRIIYCLIFLAIFLKIRKSGQ